MKKSYIAGFFDGEGCISIRPIPPAYALWLQLGAQSRIFLEEIKKQYKGNICERNKGFFVWVLSGDNALRFLEDIYPYLILKKHQAALGIAFRKHKKWLPHKHNELRKRMLKRRIWYWEKLKKLHHVT